MEIPKCRLCQQKHWPRDGCGFVQSVEEKVASPRPKPAVSSSPAPFMPAGPVAARGGSRKTAVTSETLAPFDRVAYQREYMRERRAKAKLAKPS